MSLWNKTLLGLLLVAALVFFHAAARTVKTYQHWANKTDSFEKALKERRAEVADLRTGDEKNLCKDKTTCVQQLRIDLGRVLANRGRIWSDCKMQKILTAASGVTNISVSSDEPTAFTKNMLVYAFEEGDDQSPGKYLGEFRVDEVGQNAVVLASTTPMDALLAKNVAESKTPWVLYELMPTDEHEAFANVSEDQKKWVPEEFVNDGRDFDSLTEDKKKLVKEIQDFEHLTEDDKKLVRNAGLDASGKKFRPLRDYLAIFRACDMHRTLFADRLESATRDLKYLTVAGQEASNLEATAEKEKTQVAGEVQRTIAERAAVANLLAIRQNYVGIFQASLQAAVAKNVERAGRRQAAEGLARSDRPPHPCHGTIRTEGELTEWVSTIAITTAKDAAVFG